MPNSNISDWSREGSTVAAVSRPWTGVITKDNDPVGRRALVKTEASTRPEAVRKLNLLAGEGWTLVVAIWGDHSDVITEVGPFAE